MIFETNFGVTNLMLPRSHQKCSHPCWVCWHAAMVLFGPCICCQYYGTSGRGMSRLWFLLDTNQTSDKPAQLTALSHKSLLLSVPSMRCISSRETVNELLMMNPMCQRLSEHSHRKALTSWVHHAITENGQLSWCPFCSPMMTESASWQLWVFSDVCNCKG